MLGLGSGLLSESPLGEGLIDLGTGLSLMVAADNPNANFTNVMAGFNSDGMRSLTGYDGANNQEFDKLGGTFTLTISRLDGSGNVVAGATSTGTVHAYRANMTGTSSSVIGLMYITDDSSLSGTDAFEGSGDGNLDLTTFGGVDIVDALATSSEYKFTLEATGAGYGSTSRTLTDITIDR